TMRHEHLGAVDERCRKVDRREIGLTCRTARPGDGVCHTMALAQAVEPGATDGPDHVYNEPVRHGGRGRLDWKCDVGRARGSRLCEPVPGENEDREQSTGDNE